MNDEPLSAALERATHALGLAAPSGLGQAEAHVLAFLCRRGEASMGDLHRSFGHRRSTLTGVVDRLVERGLVRRGRAESDRRSVVVSLAPAGRKPAEAVARRLDELDARVLARVGPRRLQAARAVLAVFEEEVSR